MPTNPTTHSSSTTPLAAEQQVEATRVLQRAWRKQFQYRANRELMDVFDKTSLSGAHVRSISFETLVVKLREKPLIATVKAMLQRVHLLCTFRHGSPCRALAPANVNVRVFLAAYMIAYRSTHVFESMGVLEQPLLAAATRLLDCFETIMGALRENDGQFAALPPSMTKAFPTLLFEYLKCFKAWKVPDEEKLVCRIRHALVALYQAETHLPPDEPEDSRLKIEFRTQIERLRSKLEQISGREALARFDEQRQNNTLALPPPPGGGAGAMAMLPGRMSNEQLAHELLLDPTFQLDEGGGCAIENPVFDRIRESFHQAFWDSLADDLRLSTPCYARVVRVLAEIRDGLNDLGGARVEQELVIDVDWIRQQADAGQYDWTSACRLVSAVVGVVQRLQAPRRDGETRDKWAAVERRMTAAADAAEEQPAAFCGALEFLLERVNALRIDAANARLRLISPVIRDHGIDYERGKFQDKLANGTLTLERTTRWINDTLRQEVDGRSVDLAALTAGLPTAFMAVHSAAMVRLVTELCAARADTLPETLQLDVHRIASLQVEFRYLTTAVAVLMASAHALSRAREGAAVGEVRPRLEAAVVAHRPELADEAALLSAIEVALSPLQDEELRRTTLCVLTQSTSPADPVRRLLERRLRALLARIVRDGQAPADLRAFAPARALIQRIEAMAARLGALCNLNRMVHTPTYNLVIGEAAIARAAEDARAASEAEPQGGRRRVA